MILAGAALCASFLALTQGRSPAAAAPRAFLELEQTIPLSGVQGRIDHLALDAKRDRLYVAALGNDSLEVVDLGQKKRVKSLAGLSEPQGVLYLDGIDVVVVSNGGSGNLDVLRGETHEKIQSLFVGSDADNLRYDPEAKQVFVAYGSGAVGILDALTWKPLGTMRVSAHPEAFELDPHGPRVYVNVPDGGAIELADRKTRAPAGIWPVESARANYPMKLVAEDERLLVGCRHPAKLLVFDTRSGKETAALDLSGDADDIAWDAERGRVYASCGAGFIDVFERTGSGVFAPAGKVTTRRGARTSLFAPERKRLYLAVPRDGEKPAEIRVFAVVP